MTTAVITSYKATQSDYSNSSTEEVSVAYSSTDAMRDSIMQSLMEQSTIFEAMSLAREINELNGYLVVTDWMMKKLQNHFRKNEIVKNESRLKESHFLKNEITKNETDPLETQLKSEKSKGRNHKDTYNEYRELQKGYMKLLSE